MDLDDLGSITSLVKQRLLWQKIVREDPVQLPNLIKQIQLFKTVVPLLCLQFTNFGPVLLLHVRIDRFAAHPTLISVTVRVKQNSPELSPPSWPIRSISTNHGTASSHSSHVRMGVWDLSSAPGLVWERP